jgi:hypothetical protein
MELAHGRRLSRLAISLWIAVPALVAVIVWGETAVGAYAAFVAVSAAALVAVRRAE